MTAVHNGRVNRRRIAVTMVVAVVCAVFAFVRWGALLGVIVGTALVAMILFAAVNRPRGRNEPHGLWLGFTLATFTPVAFGLLILAITPTYFRPLTSTPTGEWLLLALLVGVAASQGLVQLGLNLMSRSRPVVGGVVIALALTFSGITFVLILLGPAVAVITQPRPPA